MTALDERERVVQARLAAVAKAHSLPVTVIFTTQGPVADTGRWVSLTSKAGVAVLRDGDDRCAQMVDAIVEAQAAAGHRVSDGTRAALSACLDGEVVA